MHDTLDFKLGYQHGLSGLPNTSSNLQLEDKESYEEGFFEGRKRLKEIFVKALERQQAENPAPDTYFRKLAAWKQYIKKNS